eukprot:206009_1
MDIKTDGDGLEDTEHTEDRAINNVIANDDIFYRFQLKDNETEGVLLLSTLYQNRKNTDCAMLCRFCGIDIGDGLKAKLDDQNPYYDAKNNVFTFLNKLSWEEFGILKHWIRTQKLIIVGNQQNIQQLQKVCLFLGIDKLAQIFPDYYHPLTPREDVKNKYLWAQQPDYSPTDSNTIYHWKEIVQGLRGDGYSLCDNGHWRKLKNHDYKK